MNDFVGNEQPIGELLATAIARLAGISDSPRLDAELLLARALDVPRSYLIAHPEDCPDAGARARFDAALEQRAAGMPLAYIEGEKEFWSLPLMVSRDTLVPRPETELLVEEALKLIPLDRSCRVLDLGTGSGAIALSLARERSLADVTASDLSEAALAVAAQNARQLDIANVRFVAGYWAEPFTGQRFDLVVSNPPYVRNDDPALINLKYEPAMALASGADGLDAISELAADCGGLLESGGHLLLEHGADQGDAVRNILAVEGWTEIRLVNDLAGLPRVTCATAPS